MPFYDIAEFHLEYSGFESDYSEKRLKEYKSEKTLSADMKATLKLPAEIGKPEGNYVSTIDGYRQCYKTDGGYGLYDLLRKPDTFCASLLFDKNVKQATGEMTDISAYGGMSVPIRSFNMLGELFRYFILKNNGVVFHSSCIKYKDMGIAFSAPSGTGKSTHSGLWKKYFPKDVTIINDDSPAIRTDKGDITVYGTPWSGKTDINANISAKLGAIVMLEQNAVNSISRISIDEAVFRTLNEVSRPMFAEFMNPTLEQIEKILAKTPVFLLKCNISEEAVLAVKSELGI